MRCLIVLAKDNVYLNQSSMLWSLDEAKTTMSNALPVGVLEGERVFVSLQDPPDDCASTQPVRSTLDQLPEVLRALLLRAVALKDWFERSLFCVCCGTNMTLCTDEIAKVCPACAHRSYPGHGVSVMVLVSRGDEVLLARAAHFKKGVFSVLAGFIDAGESAEDAAVREVQEEVGLKVCDLRYFGTQSWSPAGAFIVGFTALYESGELCVDHNELEEARWFNARTLPDLPAESCLATQMIRAFLSNT